MLTSRIHVPPPPDPKPEDIFQSSLTALFKDDTQNSHGNPGDRLFYRSPLYGDITIHLPEHPYLDSNRRLFAHYLWNAGVLVADTIERASNRGDRVIETESEALNSDYWNVKGERVLELGAGTALPSIVSMLAGASEVCVTDHPSSPALSSKTIVTNVQASFELAKTRNPNPIFSVEAHEWGLITDPFSKAKQNRYTRVIGADCLWMSSQHRNLVQSIAHFLCKESPNACALVVAGFHTGNNIVADFFKQFQTLKGRDNIAEELSVAEIYESDMNSERRPWQESRANENREDAKRCCVVAVIVRVRVV